MRKKGYSSEYYEKELAEGNRVALARAITAIESNRADASSVFRAINGKLTGSHVVGITGAPGAGKSTLVNAYVAELRKRGRTVGVIAIDPSSPFSGGAILGDRIRMSEHGADDGVFVRSLAARGHLGGLSKATAHVVDIMDAAGMDVVIIETVGTGQSEVEIMEIADTVVVVSAPGLGDEIQAVKAGILEIADIMVVNKADMPHVDSTYRQLKDAISFGPARAWKVPIVKTISTNGEGFKELADIADAHFQTLDAAERKNAAINRMRKVITTTATHFLKVWLKTVSEQEINQLSAQVLRGEIGLEQASRMAANLAVDTGKLDTENQRVKS
ncbi:MAG: methylmalonyl Co-A mutase-associated GTPase MeaB [Rhodobacteraceae bacterium]|nr:methylmalonyl Co-A mutase-associated GTPase MeaB [Paracoccaceae bacterium]